MHFVTTHALWAAAPPHTLVKKVSLLLLGGVQSPESKYLHFPWADTWESLESLCFLTVHRGKPWKVQTPWNKAEAINKYLIIS